MKILNLLIDSFFSPRVLHSLPGRLRIHVPGLKQLQPDALIVEILNDNKDRVTPGIHSIEPNFITGNILFHYDPDQTNESRILAMLKALEKTAVKYSKKLKQYEKKELSTEQINRVTEQMVAVLENSPGFLLGEELELPDEIWI